jgi:hypothetical protein
MVGCVGSGMILKERQGMDEYGFAAHAWWAWLSPYNTVSTAMAAVEDSVVTPFPVNM